MTTIDDQLVRIQQIYLEPEVEDYPRGREILARFPAAERIVVPSHWNIPGLHGNEGLATDWLRIKRDVLVLGVRKSLTARANGRSSHWVAASAANGCAMACAYCYVPRRKGFANPISVFVNIEQIAGYLQRHAKRQGPKPEDPHDQIDSKYWVYDIGENSDLSIDAMISDNVRDLVALFRQLPNAKASFASKYVNRELLELDPQGKTRIRFSLMPESMARLLDVRTSPVPERIAAINEFVAAGYEVHINLSPVIVYEGWLADYRELLGQLDAALSAPAKAQLAAEIIFLTHNQQLHEVNLRWHPKAEAVLWQPNLQEAKVSQTGGHNLRYRAGRKRTLVRQLCELMAEQLPYCRIRYAF